MVDASLGGTDELRWEKTHKKQNKMSGPHIPSPTQKQSTVHPEVMLITPVFLVDNQRDSDGVNLLSTDLKKKKQTSIGGQEHGFPVQKLFCKLIVYNFI